MYKLLVKGGHRSLKISCKGSLRAATIIFIINSSLSSFLTCEMWEKMKSTEHKATSLNYLLCMTNSPKSKGINNDIRILKCEQLEPENIWHFFLILEVT